MTERCIICNRPLEKDDKYTIEDGNGAIVDTCINCLKREIWKTVEGGGNIRLPADWGLIPPPTEPPENKRFTIGTVKK